jgi:hypothetical protein
MRVRAIAGENVFAAAEWPMIHPEKLSFSPEQSVRVSCPLPIRLSIMFLSFVHSPPPPSTW